MRSWRQTILCTVLAVLDISTAAGSSRKSTELQINQFGQFNQSKTSPEGFHQGELTLSTDTLSVFERADNESFVTDNESFVTDNEDVEHSKSSPEIQTDLPHLQDLPRDTEPTSVYQELFQAIQDEADDVNHTSRGAPESQVIIERMLGMRWDKVLKTILAHERLDVLFPRQSNISINCYNNLLAFVDGLVGVVNEDGNYVTAEWALQMLDAIGKPSAGLMEGVFQWVGNYEQCLETQARYHQADGDSHKIIEFDGKYCRVQIDVSHIVKVSFPANINQFWLLQKTFPVAINWGVCVPDSCNAADIVEFLTTGTMAVMNLPIQKAVCFGESRFSVDPAAITTVVILCVFVAVVTVCTTLDIYYYRPWVVIDARMEAATVGGGEIKGGASSMQEMQPVARVEETQRNGSSGAQLAETELHATASQYQAEAAIASGAVPSRENGNREAGGAHAATGNKKTIKSKHKVIVEQLIQGMSLYRNMSSLLRKSRSQGTFDCIQGMRVISLAWIVVGHCYTYGGMLDENNLIFENSAELVETSARLSFHIVGSAHLAVDTFFVISGCLSMLLTLRSLRRNKSGCKFWSQFLLHRFWRLTPLYMVVMMVGVTLYDHVVQGPLKSPNLAEFQQCRHKWWSHLLYINNFYMPHSKCMTWSWFMAVDMQLFLVSPIFIYTVHRNIKVGITLICSLMLFGVTSAFLSEYVHGGQFVLMDLSFLDYWSYVYTMPWARASVFAIGLLLGVILYKQIGLAVLSKRIAFCVWVVVISLAILLILINHHQWKHNSHNWTRVQQSFYESLVRPAWAICMAWVIFACCNDLGGYANTILGWRPFLVLSRLTYSLYLLHPMVILFVVYSRRTTIYLDPANINLVYNYVGNLTFTFLLSAVFSMIFEMPLAAMETILWRSL